MAHFEVDDLERVIRDLTARGVTFEEYETPKTINFIAQVGSARRAWFKDPDGNVFGCARDPYPPRSSSSRIQPGCLSIYAAGLRIGGEGPREAGQTEANGKIIAEEKPP